MRLVLAAVVLGMCALVEAQSRDKLDLARHFMVERDIVREGIRNKAVIKSMDTVPRHEFVKPEYVKDAYFDQALPIGNKQTISPPFIVAYMTETLDPQPTDRVLEIGTGSGYQAAVLSSLVKDVYTIEIVDQLGKNAAKVLNKLKYENVHTRIGDGYKGWPEAAPFDKIIVTCSPEKVPQPLIDQLKDGGRMIVPLGERYEQVFYLFEKQNGELVKTRLLPALFVPMTGVAEDSRQVKPDPKHPEIHNGSFEGDVDNAGHPVGWHYQRQLTLETANAPDGKRFVTLENRDPGRSSQILQAMIMDGRAVSTLTISLQVSAQNVRNDEGNQAAAMLHYFDADRRPMEVEVLWTWERSFDWKTVTKTIVVPAKSREAVLRIGLNGAVGRLNIDEVRISAQAK